MILHTWLSLTMMDDASQTMNYRVHSGVVLPSHLRTEMDNAVIIIDVIYNLMCI